MKKTELFELFQMLDDDEQELLVEMQSELKVDQEKILKMTMERVEGKRKKQGKLYFVKMAKRTAACIVSATVLGTGVFVAANEGIIGKIERISKPLHGKVQTYNQSICGQDFEVVVVESKFDGNIGQLSFWVKGVSEEGKESIENPELHTFDKMFKEDIRLTVPGMYGLSRKLKGHTQYFELNFTNNIEEGDIVRFTSLNDEKHLDIVLQETFDTREIDIRGLSDDLRNYEKLEYSALGIKIIGTKLKNPYKPTKELYFKFKVRYKDGKEEKLTFAGSSFREANDNRFGAVYSFEKEFDWNEVEAISVNDMWF